MAETANPERHAARVSAALTILNQSRFGDAARLFVMKAFLESDLRLPLHVEGEAYPVLIERVLRTDEQALKIIRAAAWATITGGLGALMTSDVEGQEKQAVARLRVAIELHEAIDAA